MIGKVKKIIQDRGFGFIKSESLKEDIFFHRSQIMNTYIHFLEVGQDVEFDVRQTPKGYEATNVYTIIVDDSITTEDESVMETSQ